MSDHLGWDDQNEKLLLLQEKLNLYLSSIESGEVFEQYPLAKNKLFEIQVVSKYQPNNEAKEFILLALKFVREAGFSLTHDVRDYN
ncbi:TPA: DUF6572 domain-containing protein [Vibrio diabolicus]